MIRRAIALVVGAVMLATSGCALTQGSGSGGGDDDQVVIGLAVANLQADFFNQIRQAVEAQAKTKDVEVIVSDAKGDSDTQVSQIQDFITQDVDAIIYIPAGATAATVPVREARNADIPVVTVDRNPEGAPGDTFIATDSVAAARDLGEWLVQDLGGRGNVGVIQGQVGTTPEIARDTGFKEALKGTDVTIVASQASKQWAQDEGFDLATDILQSNGDVNAFFGRADALALGAAQAVRNANRDDIKVVGFDGDKAGLEAVRDGVLDATICQPTQKMGALAVDSALRLADGEKLPEEQLQKGVLTTPDNVEPFIQKHP